MNLVPYDLTNIFYEHMAYEHYPYDLLSGHRIGQRASCIHQTVYCFYPESLLIQPGSLLYQPETFLYTPEGIMCQPGPSYIGQGLMCQLLGPLVSARGPPVLARGPPLSAMGFLCPSGGLLLLPEDLLYRPWAGMEIYILLGLHVRPPLKKRSTQAHASANPTWEKTICWTKMIRCLLPKEIFRHKKAFRRPERALCWCGRHFVGLRGPFLA